MNRIISETPFKFTYPLSDYFRVGFMAMIILCTLIAVKMIAFTSKNKLPKYKKITSGSPGLWLVPEDDPSANSAPCAFGERG